jgi:BD-FAE
MARHCACGWDLSAVAAAILLAGCSASASPPPVPSHAPTPPPSVSTATTSPTGAPPVTQALGLPYEATNPVLAPGSLDVYSPGKAGPWPVVVMFHGAGPTKAEMSVYATRVADLGHVVFVPEYNQPAANSTTDLLSREGLAASGSQVACAIAFAAAQATRYGGDPATLIVFGHSAGAMAAAGTVFGRPVPTAGCLGGATLPPVSALVTWEGDWLLGWDPVWESVLAADPGMLDAATVWPVLSRDKNVRVAMLLSDEPGMPDLPVAKLAVRDPTGVLRKQLLANGALADGKVTDAESQQLLFSVLKAQGNPVTLDVMPGSTHDSLSDQGWKVFLGAFSRAADS